MGRHRDFKIMLCVNQELETDISAKDPRHRKLRAKHSKVNRSLRFAALFLYFLYL